MIESSITYRVIQDISRIMRIKMYSNFRLRKIISMYARKRGMTSEQAVEIMCEELRQVVYES